MQLVHQQKSGQKTSRPIFLLCVFRDENLLLEYFVNYYRSLGVTHFIMIDNQSEDNGPDYLKCLRDINLWLYNTKNSYRDAAYGTTWVNQLLERHCTGHFCFTVDVDEIFLLDTSRYETLYQLVDDMELEGANVVPTTLLDMYPKETNDNYKRGQNFLSHSPFFDDLNVEYYEERGPIYGTFVHKVGGVRKRVLGTTVCIHKFPFFKYDFNPVGVSPGYHFFQAGGKVLRQCNKIRLHPQPEVLLHFKFIKPGFQEFVEQRVTRNEDWDNSGEYRAYSEVLVADEVLVFFDRRFSKKLISVKDVDRILGF